MIDSKNVELIVDLLILYKEDKYKSYLLEIQRLMNDNTLITDADNYYDEFITTHKDTFFTLSKISINLWIKLVYNIYHIPIED